MSAPPPAVGWHAPSPTPVQRPTFTAPAAWAQPITTTYRQQPLTVSANGVTIVMDDTHLRVGLRVIALSEITAVAFPGLSQSLGPVERVAVSTRDESLTIPLGTHGQPRTPAAHADIERFLDRLWIEVMPRVAADAIDHVAYGLALHIGGLRLERLGFGANSQMYPWNAYGNLSYQPDGFTITHIAHGRTTPITQIGSGDLNAAVMPAIVEHLARHVGRSHPLTVSERRSIDIGLRPRTALTVDTATPAFGYGPNTTATAVTRQKRPMKAILALVAVIALIVVGLFVRRSQMASDSNASTRRTPVSAWDARVLDLVVFVEKEHGKPFKHPVAMSFLNDAAFLARLHKGDRKPKNPKAAAEKQATTEAILRARGYAGPEHSLNASDDESDGRVLGVYFPDTDTIAVRGDTLDAFGKLVIVHELTHAWQRQHYPLDELDDSLDSETDLFLDTQTSWRAATLPELGIASIAVRRGADVCVRSAPQIPSDTDRATLNNALSAWIAAVPSDKATLTDNGSTVTFTSCDPGDHATVPPQDVFKELYSEVLAERLAGVHLEAINVDRERASCALEHFRSTFDIETMTDDDLNALDLPTSVVEAAGAALADCSPSNG
jgi:hypothetical protein